MPMLDYIPSANLLGVSFSWMSLVFAKLQLIFLLVGVAAITLLAFVGKIPIQYNLRNLVVRWPTTVMISLAFSLVVGLLVTMLAFVNGMSKLTEGTGQPGNVMVLSDGALDEGFSNLGFSDIGDIENQPQIERYQDRPLVSHETFLVVNQPVIDPQPNRPKRRFIQLRGIDNPEFSVKVHGLELTPGSQLFSAAGVEEVAASEGGDARSLIQALMGEGIARQLGSDRTPEQLAAAKNKERLDVGDRFQIAGRTWVIAGILKSNGSTFDAEIWAKRSLIGPLLGKDRYTTIVCRTANPEAAKALTTYYNEEFDKAAVKAQLETDYFSNLSATNKLFLGAISILAFIMSIGGVFGVMNTMFAAISQRTKDIGVLRIIGFKRWQILTCFLLESLFLAFLGGIAGCAVGCLAHGWKANSIVGSGQGGGKFVVLEMVVNSDTLAVGMVVALAMGFVGGFLPAVLATLKKPLESLR